MFTNNNWRFIFKKYTKTPSVSIQWESFSYLHTDMTSTSFWWQLFLSMLYTQLWQHLTKLLSVSHHLIQFYKYEAVRNAIQSRHYHHPWLKCNFCTWHLRRPLKRALITPHWQARSGKIRTGEWKREKERERGRERGRRKGEKELPLTSQQQDIHKEHYCKLYNKRGCWQLKTKIYNNSLKTKILVSPVCTTCTIDVEIFTLLFIWRCLKP